MKKRYYAVAKGFQCGVIVQDWNECKRLVDGFSGAIFKGFAAYHEAEAFVRSHEPDDDIDPSQGIVFIPPSNKKNKYGHFRERYYRKDGVLHADYGTHRSINPPAPCDGVPWD